MDDRILISNIQRFSLHDGPGIRTTVFLKGCSLHCPWCSNPENILPQMQNYNKDGIEGVFGKFYTAEELIKECLKDIAFYKGDLNSFQWDIKSADDIELLPGGVTFSGGEPLLQIMELIPVISALHGAGIHIAVETSLFVSGELLSIAIAHIDFFYVDVKILDPDKADEIEHGDLNLYFKNLEILISSLRPVVIRIPVIGGYTDLTENRKRVFDLLSQYKERILKLELIKEHNLGKSKYESLGIEFDYHGVEDSLLDEYRNELSCLGIPIEVCKI